MLFGITLALSVAISLSQANGAPQESNFASPASVFEEALPSSELIEKGAKLAIRSIKTGSAPNIEVCLDARLPASKTSDIHLL